MNTAQITEKLDLAIGLQVVLSHAIEQSKELGIDSLFDACIEQARHIEILLKECSTELGSCQWKILKP